MESRSHESSQWFDDELVELRAWFARRSMVHRASLTASIRRADDLRIDGATAAAATAGSAPRCAATSVRCSARKAL
mgnify:CR=1 FL=1